MEFETSFTLAPFVAFIPRDSHDTVCLLTLLSIQSISAPNSYWTLS